MPVFVVVVASGLLVHEGLGKASMPPVRAGSGMQKALAPTSAHLFLGTT